MTKRQSRIALFTPSLAGGGAERFMLNLSRGIADRGYDVDVVVSVAEGKLIEQLDKRVELVSLGATRVLRSVPALIRYLRARNPDAMLATQTHANVAALAARTLSRATTRIVVRDSYSSTGASALTREPIGNRVVNYLSRFLYPRANGVVAICNDMKPEISSRTHLCADDITTIYSPVDIEHLRQLAKTPVNHHWFNSHSTKLVLSVGRLEEQKGYESLIQAFALVRRCVDARLLILGEGSLRQPLTDLITSLDLTDVVDLPGFIPNPYPYIANADLFVLSSLFEGLPNVLLETMAIGTAIVSTDCKTGPREILRNGIDGILVPVGATEALADAIVTSLAADKTTVDYGDSICRFNFETAVDQYLKLLLPNESDIRAC